jgi:hypothetical protein
MTTSLVAAYQKGAITADHLVVQCLHMIDPESPGLVLDPLPHELADRMLEFTRQFRAGRMVTNYGTLPTADQVEAARRWIEEHHGRRDPAPQSDDLDRNGDQPGIHAPDPEEPIRNRPLREASGVRASRMD